MYGENRIADLVFKITHTLCARWGPACPIGQTRHCAYISVEKRHVCKSSTTVNMLSLGAQIVGLSLFTYVRMWRLSQSNLCVCACACACNVTWRTPCVECYLLQVFDFVLKKWVIQGRIDYKLSHVSFKATFKGCRRLHLMYLHVEIGR